jgi:hypothetical protein
MPAVARSALSFANALALAAIATASHATEGGGSTYNGGVENFLTGAAPPPGLHLLAYGQYYEADKSKDNEGNDAPTPPDFKVRAAAAVFRGVWVTPQHVLGGNLLFETIVPLADLKVTAGGQTDHKTGIGDVELGGGIAFHHSPSLHSAVALDVLFPTASYSATALANLGHHYVSFHPLYTVSLIDPAGFNADFKAVLTLNRENSDTHYKSGDEAFVDYSAGWGLGNGWVLGLGGYLRKQFTDDKLNGAEVANNRARAFAIGPSIAYNNGKGWFITAKWQDETSVRNTTEGAAFWIKTVIPF